MLTVRKILFKLHNLTDYVLCKWLKINLSLLIVHFFTSIQTKAVAPNENEINSKLNTFLTVSKFSFLAN